MLQKSQIFSKKLVKLGLLGVLVWSGLGPSMAVAQQSSSPKTSGERNLAPVTNEKFLSQTAPPNILKSVEKIRHPVKAHPLKPDRRQVIDTFYETEFLSDRIIYYQREVPQNLRRREALERDKLTKSKIIGSLEFKLKSIWLEGGQTLWNQDVGFSSIQAERNTVTYQRTPKITEVYEARDGALKQSWVLQDNPALNSDLIIEGELRTILQSKRSQKGHIEFMGQEGEHVVSYGKAVILDAQSVTLEVEPVYDSTSQTVTIQVPGEWLSQATYPVIIDPLIGNESAINTAADAQSWVQIAFDGTNYMVVWEDYRNYSLVDSVGFCTQCIDIYGTRIRASDGMVLDAEGIAISTAN
ncbi:MAG: hypothetical protein L0Y56_22540, partial [Nitrospira sp.]|nr:hypothetical protein [Nitrospira sp.]